MQLRSRIAKIEEQLSSIDNGSHSKDITAEELSQKIEKLRPLLKKTKVLESTQQPIENTEELIAKIRAIKSSLG
jgi:hypothetical protein